MGDYRLEGIPVTGLSQVWGEVQPLIAKVIPYTGGRQNEKTLADALLNRDMQLWVIRNGEGIKTAFVTQIVNFPTGLKVAEYIVLGGEDADAWLALQAEVEEWARAQGCYVMQVVGRPGWEKMLKKNGFKKLTVMLDKDLYEGE